MEFPEIFQRLRRDCAPDAGGPVRATHRISQTRALQTFTGNVGAPIAARTPEQPRQAGSAQQITKVKDAFARDQKVFLRAQKISFGDQIRSATRFGSLGRHLGAQTIGKPTDRPLVRKFHWDGTSERILGEHQHSDQRCAAVSLLGSMLYNRTVRPDGGGDTMFASNYVAYEALIGADESVPRRAHGDARRRAGARGCTPTSSHPVIIRHPESGCRGFFVDADFTSHINELPRNEGDAILGFLHRHSGRDECCSRWRPHPSGSFDPSG